MANFNKIVEENNTDINLLVKKNAIKVFYVPNNKKIIAKYKGKFYNLPNLEEIDKPENIIPCIGFIKSDIHSQWCDVPDNEEEFYTKLESFMCTKHTLKIHKLLLSIEYTRNEVNERLFRLHGYVPNYVLNGLCKILKM